MVPDRDRTSSRMAVTSLLHADGRVRDSQRVTAQYTRRDLPPPPPPMPPPPPPPRERTRTSRTPTASGSAPESSAQMFLGRNYFHCPQLDQRMKKYLVRLANETANHLIRDTLEPDNAHLVWKPMATVKGIEILRGYEQPQQTNGKDLSAALKDATCLRGVAQVSASIEEFAMLFKLDTNRQLAEHGLLFNPDLLDMTTLYSLVQPSGDHPRRYVGIKWCLVQSPSRLFRNRDFCYLECQKEFRDANGRRGWVRSMHSIKMPCCPSLEKSHGVVRASLYRCGLIAVETDKPGVLDTTYTIEMDLKGHFPEIFQPKFLSQRIAALASIDKYLQQQRLSSSPLLGDLDIPKTKLKGSCHFCFREFSTFTKRHICRKCGEVVCRHCSDDWQLDVPVIGSMKVRICTVCSAEARMCHATPRQTVCFDLPESSNDSDELMKPDKHYHGRGPGRVRRSNSMPEHDEYGESPFQKTAQELPRSNYHSTGSIDPVRLRQMEPSEYFALQRQQYRESQAYRESDFTTDIRDFTNGEIRGTADITALWTKHDADRYGGQNDTFHQRDTSHRHPSHAAMMRRATTQLVAKSPETEQFRARIPSDVSGRSVFRESAIPDTDYGHDGHFPPSVRYTVVDDRLERSNSLDAGRQFEKRQQHLQQDHQRHDYQQPQKPNPASSRRNPPLSNESYSPPTGYLKASRPNSSLYQSNVQQPGSPHARSARQNQQFRISQRQAESRLASPQHQETVRRKMSVESARQQTTPTAQAPRNVALEFIQSNTTPRNVALEFAQSNTTPRNVALEFAQSNTTPRNIALQFANQPQSNTTPRNIALEFANQSQAPSNGQSSRNIALDFLKLQQMPSQISETQPFGIAKVPWSQMVDGQPEPPRSPDLVGGTEPVEYEETDSGEWIASDRWKKGPLVAPILNLDGGEPLETRECDKCGAKQYVHEGVVEATCECDMEDELVRPSVQNRQSERDGSRVSFRVDANVFDSNDSFIDPLRAQNDSFGGEKVDFSVDVDPVVPIFGNNRLSHHSLRSSFDRT